MVIKSLEFILGFTMAISIEVCIVVIYYSLRSVINGK